MLEKYPPDFYASKRDLRGNSIPIVVVGFGKMGQNLVKQAARIGHYTLWPMLDISVVGPNIKEGADKFLAIYGDSQTPRSFVVPDVNINFIDCDPECISSLADITGTANQNKKPVAVYIALDNDSLAVSLAFQIRSILDSNDIPIIVCMHSSLADLMEGKKTQFILNHNIHAFNILNAACGYQSLMENVTDALARSIHEIYLASQKEVAAFMRWENLDEIMKDANRWSADHLSTKLRTIGFDGQDLSIFDKIKNDETFIEKLSEMEHRRWMAERFMDGWRFGDKRNNKKKIHNLLVPYNQLSDQEKSKDTDMINNMKKLVTSSGWEIHNKFFKNADL